MSEQTEYWKELDAQLKAEFGKALEVRWVLERRLRELDEHGSLLEPAMPSTESSLTIVLDPRVLDSNPRITLVAGERIFSVIEETR